MVKAFFYRVLEKMPAGLATVLGLLLYAVYSYRVGKWRREQEVIAQQIKANIPWSEMPEDALSVWYNRESKTYYWRMHTYNPPHAGVWEYVAPSSENPLLSKV